ncbi:hypothetical protein OC861_000852 [Tilletia horrida]|nr:hypothetical protein OC861_000852 [Tilletia horrida]
MLSLVDDADDISLMSTTTSQPSSSTHDSSQDGNTGQTGTKQQGQVHSLVDQASGWGSQHDLLRADEPIAFVEDVYWKDVPNPFSKTNHSYLAVQASKLMHTVPLAESTFDNHLLRRDKAQFLSQVTKPRDEITSPGNICVIQCPDLPLQFSSGKRETQRALSFKDLTNPVRTNPVLEVQLGAKGVRSTADDGQDSCPSMTLCARASREEHLTLQSGGKVQDMLKASEAPLHFHDKTKMHSFMPVHQGLMQLEPYMDHRSRIPQGCYTHISLRSTGGAVQSDTSLQERGHQEFHAFSGSRTEPPQLVTAAFDLTASILDIARKRKASKSDVTDSADQVRLGEVEEFLQQRRVKRTKTGASGSRIENRAQDVQSPLPAPAEPEDSSSYAISFAAHNWRRFPASIRMLQNTQVISHLQVLKVELVGNENLGIDISFGHGAGVMFIKAALLGESLGPDLYTDPQRGIYRGLLRHLIQYDSVKQLLIICEQYTSSGFEIELTPSMQAHVDEIDRLIALRQQKFSSTSPSRSRTPTLVRMSFARSPKEAAVHFRKFADALDAAP